MPLFDDNYNIFSCSKFCFFFSINTFKLLIFLHSLFMHCLLLKVNLLHITKGPPYLSKSVQVLVVSSCLVYILVI